MSGGGMANLNGIKATDPSAIGTQAAPQTAQNFGSALGAAMGIGGAGGGTAGQAGSSGPLGPYLGPITDADRAGLNNMNSMMNRDGSGNVTGFNANTPMASQPAQPASPNDTISGYYQNILQRAPDQAGLDYWNQQAKSGMSLDAIKQNFLGSQEFNSDPSHLEAWNKYNASMQQPQHAAPQSPAPYVPTTTTWSAPQQQQVFSGPTAVTQSGGEGSGGAMNYQYRRGGIASLVR